jgi:hypothetical protein
MKDFERDIALATALAHCGIARDAADRGRAGMACAQMDEALGLLKAYNCAPGLAAQVVDALDQLKPAALLDDLKAPLDLDDKVSGRQLAVAAFKSLLNGGGRDQQATTLFVGPAVAGGCVMDRDYIASAFKTLTSVELCSLADWSKLATTADLRASSSSPSWFEPSMLSAAGLAHIAAGFTTRQPSYIATAKKIYSAAATREAGVDVNIPLAVCEVLLGNPEKALTILKQDEEMAAPGGSFSLSAHDAALSVAVALESKRINQLPPREGVVQFIRAASSMGMSSNPATFNGDLLPGLCLFVERWLAIVVLPKLRDTRRLVSAGSRNNVSLGTYFDDDAVQEALVKENSSSSSSSSSLVSLAAGLGNSKVVKAVKSLGGVRTFVVEEGGARQLIAGAMLAMFGGAVLLGCKYGMFGSSNSSSGRRMHLLPPPSLATSAAADASVTGTTTNTNILTTLTSKRMTDSTSTQQQQQEISGDAALRLVKQWLDVKAQAMGPRHVTNNLAQVLAPPMLSAVKAEAQEAAESGWFWTIRPNGVKIDSIDCSSFKGAQQQQGMKGGSGSNKGHVVVVATIDESADLWASNGKKGDSYKTKYRVEYDMVKVGDEWKIASALVLGGK